MIAKKLIAVAAVALTCILGTTGVASANSGTNQGDLAPHSNGTTAALVNGDTNITGIGSIPVTVNIPIGQSKTGPQQIGTEHAGPQLDAPVNDDHSIYPLPVLLPF